MCDQSDGESGFKHDCSSLPEYQSLFQVSNDKTCIVLDAGAPFNFYLEKSSSDHHPIVAILLHKALDQANKRFIQMYCFLSR